MKFFIFVLIVAMFGCINNEEGGATQVVNTSGSTQVIEDTKKEEDCDDKKAKETLEKIKTEEFSLSNSKDTGCSVDEKK